MKFVLFLIACVVVAVSAGFGDSVSDMVTSFKDATKDHVSRFVTQSWNTDSGGLAVDMDVRC